MLLAALVNGLGARKLGAMAGIIACAAMGVALVSSLAVFAQVWGLSHGEEPWSGTRILLWNWMDVPSFFGADRPFRIDFAFFVDQLTALYLCFVSFIGFFVFIYATGYMKEKHDGHVHLDPGYARFFSYVSLFAASMFILVLGDNMAVMFIGWEGVGLCSYLLIGYFFDKPFSDTLSCADAGRKAFVVNRIGDAGLIVGMGLIFWGLGTVNFQELNHILITQTLPNGEAVHPGFLYGGVFITAATLAMFLGATGKSAQIPLFTWLPDAMAGPTPVSALIHAATMVTAGIYMVARLNVLYFLSPITLSVIAIVGALTAFAAATMGLTQRGIKKALAYSTVSQLGFMFLGLGVGSMAAGIFHVFTHAFFKGCLFLCAGSVIHALHHEEDMFKMGGLKKYMPKTWICYLLATLCIAGFPLTSGFFSKDEILFSAFISAGDEFPFLWLIGVVTAVMTSIYMGRTLFLTFHGEERIDPHAKAHLHESPASMTVPLFVLAGLALVIGFLNVPSGIPIPGVPKAAFHHFLAPVVDKGAEHVAVLTQHSDATHHAGEGDHYVNGSLIVAGADSPYLTHDHHALEFKLALLSGGLAIGGLLVAWFLFGSGLTAHARALANGLKPLWSMSYNCWWWDRAYNALFQRGTVQVSNGVWKADIKLVDGAVVGIGRALRSTSNCLRGLQNGQVQIYGLFMVIGVCAFLLYFGLGLGSFLETAYDRTDDVAGRNAAQRIERLRENARAGAGSAAADLESVADDLAARIAP
jgi:NADH-quinone oxidoreductase subunit L